jgi:drug/metabolite transporter (DMT)-like permease
MKKLITMTILFSSLTLGYLLKNELVEPQQVFGLIVLVAILIVSIVNYTNIRKE